MSRRLAVRDSSLSRWPAVLHLRASTLPLRSQKDAREKNAASLVSAAGGVKWRKVNLPEALEATPVSPDGALDRHGLVHHRLEGNRVHPAPLERPHEAFQPLLRLLLGLLRLGQLLLRLDGVRGSVQELLLALVKAGLERPGLALLLLELVLQARYLALVLPLGRLLTRGGGMERRSRPRAPGWR